MPPTQSKMSKALFFIIGTCRNRKNWHTFDVAHNNRQRREFLAEYQQVMGGGWKFKAVNPEFPAKITRHEWEARDRLNDEPRLARLPSPDAYQPQRPGPRYDIRSSEDRTHIRRNFEEAGAFVSGKYNLITPPGRITLLCGEHNIFANVYQSVIWYDPQTGAVIYAEKFFWYPSMHMELLCFIGCSLTKTEASADFKTVLCTCYNEI